MRDRRNHFSQSERNFLTAYLLLNLAAFGFLIWYLQPSATQFAWGGLAILFTGAWGAIVGLMQSRPSRDEGGWFSPWYFVKAIGETIIGLMLIPLIMIGSLASAFYFVAAAAVKSVYRRLNISQTVGAKPEHWRLYWYTLVSGLIVISSSAVG